MTRNKHLLGVAAAFSGKVTGAALGLLFSIVLARLLGSSGTGIYFLALTIVSIGMTVSRLGLDNAILRFSSIAKENGDLETLAALFRKGITLVILAGMVIVLLVWLLLPYLPLGGERSADLQAVVKVMLLGLVPAAIVTLQGEFFKAIGKPGVATIFQAVLMPSLLLVGIAYLLWRGASTVTEAAVVYTAAATLSAVMAVVAWIVSTPGTLKKGGHFDTIKLLRTSLPLLWVAGMNLVMSWTDILVLGLWTDSSTVGIYGIATRIASLTAFILVAVNSVTAPRFATLYARGEHEVLERLAQRSAGWMLVAALPVITVLMIFPGWILMLFGKDFADGDSLLRVLALGQLVNVALGSVGYLLMMTGHERHMRNNILVTALINLGGTIMLVPEYGAMGAAISTAFSLSLMNVFAYWMVRKELRVNTLGYLVRRS